MPEGSPCVPETAGGQPAGPARGELGPELCARQSGGHRGARRHCLCPARRPPALASPLRLAPGASSEFCLWSSRSVDCSGHGSLLPARGASKLSPRGQAGRSMSASFPSSSLEDLHWLCLRPFVPRKEHPEWELSQQGLGTVPSTHPRQRVYTWLTRATC